MTKVRQEPLIPHLATVLTHLVTEHHLGQGNRSGNICQEERTYPDRMFDVKKGHVETTPGLHYCPNIFKVQLILEALDTLHNVLMAPLYVSYGCQGSLSVIVLSSMISAVNNQSFTWKFRAWFFDFPSFAIMITFFQMLCDLRPNSFIT